MNSMLSNLPDGFTDAGRESADGVVAWVDNVRTVTRALLPLGYPTVERVSVALGTSTRTLQRKLHEADMTYSQLVDECRLAAACPLLETTSLRLAEISSKLGFADPGSFTRFFVRVTSETPRDYRRCHYPDCRRQP
jgi:AraC-like DNA-binding protein